VCSSDLLDHVTDADDARQLALGEDWYVSESAQGHRLADFFDGVLGGTGVDVGGHDVRDGYGKQSRTMASEPTDHVTFGNDADERALAGHDGGTDVVLREFGEQVGDGRFRCDAHHRRTLPDRKSGV